MKKRLGPQNRIYPMPIPLIMSGVGDEASMLALAWITCAGSKPPAVAMVMGRRHHTLALIRETGEFTVNFAPTRLATEVDYCGLTSGRDTDKVADTGLTLVSSAVVAPPLIAECPFNLECRLMGEIELPTGSLMIVGEIVETHANEDVLDETGEKPSVALMDPLVYITGEREYWTLGEKIADAYSVGKTLK